MAADEPEMGLDVYPKASARAPQLINPLHWMTRGPGTGPGARKAQNSTEASGQVPLRTDEGEWQLGSRHPSSTPSPIPPPLSLPSSPQRTDRGALVLSALVRTAGEGTSRQVPLHVLTDEVLPSSAQVTRGSGSTQSCPHQLRATVPRSHLANSLQSVTNRAGDP